MPQGWPFFVCVASYSTDLTSFFSAGEVRLLQDVSSLGVCYLIEGAAKHMRSIHIYYVDLTNKQNSLLTRPRQIETAT